MKKINGMYSRAGDKLLDMCSSDLVSYEDVVYMCLNYMDEDEIENMMEVNDIKYYDLEFLH